jgi:hypothetical protein
MATPSTHLQKQSKGKIAERIAFDPFLPKEDLINEFIRNTINPDIDQGKTYYVGRILDIIENDDSLLDNRDIFYSPSDNYERVVRATNSNKYNEGRKVLIVHVPSFITGASYPPRTALNYYIFNKLRIEYRGKENPKIGDIVKVSFGNMKDFTDPEILSIEPGDPNYVDKIKPATDSFKKYEDCRISNLKTPTIIGSNNISIDTNPPGGYKQALEEIKNIFLDTYIKGFIDTIKIPGPSETEFGKIQNIVLRLNKVGLNANVFTQYSSTYNFIEVDNSTQNTYLIRGNDILISCENPQKNDELRNKFYNYVKKDFDSRLSYLFSFNNAPADNTFLVDINLNFLENKQTKTVEDYLRISKVFDELNYFPFSNPASKPTEQEASNGTVKRKDIVDKCEKELAKDKSIYPVVYDGKSFNNKITTDNDVIEAYYKASDDNSFVNAYIKQDYFYKLLGIKENEFEKYLKSKNSKFYQDGFVVVDKYNEKENIVGISAIKNNFKLIQSFMKQLIKEMEILEQYGENSGKILVLPFQVLKIKEKTKSKQNDENSRHYYGKAFDIRVYLKDSDPTNPNKFVIRQMRPEIVTLYLNLIKTYVIGVRELGQGMFLDESKRYNHIEFLESTSGAMGLPVEEYNQKLLFVSKDSNDPLEDEIKKNGGSNRIQILKNKIRTNSNYYYPNTNILDPRFDVLTQ